MQRADLRLLPAAACIWALAVLGVAAGAAAAVAAGALLISLALTVIVLAGHGPRQALFAHVGIVVLAGVLLFPALLRHGDAAQTLEDAAAEGVVVELTVIAGGDPSPPASGPAWSQGGLQVMARTERGPARLGREQVTLPASLPLLVRAQGEAAPGLARARDGDPIRIRGVLRTSGSLVVLSAFEATPLHGSGPGAWAQTARHALRQQARAATDHLPADEAALVRGMTSGDTTGLSEESEEIMRRAGISHLVAVSGANIALVLAAVLGPLLLAGVRRRPRIVIAGTVVAGYVWLVGDEPSVQRAATMAVPLLAARFAGVRASPVAVLALTVALWSVLDPVTAASVGFLLSALATAAILIAAPPLASAIAEASGQRLGEGLSLVIAVPLVAQLACTPLLILLTPEISLWAVPVNMLVGPLVGPSTVVGLLALVVGTLWPAAARLLDTVAAGGAHLVLLIARTADALPGSRITVPAGATGVLLAIAAILALTIAIAARRAPLVRWATAAVLVATLAPELARHLPTHGAPEWTMAVCAVGQGDAVLLRSAAGTAEQTTVLLDTGPDPAALRDCLDRLSVHRLDLLVLTHPHADHTGGREALTGSRAPDEQWICPLPDAARSVVPDVPVTVATTGHSWQREGLALEVLWPGSAQDAIVATAREDGSGEGDAANDCSVVVAATWPDGTRMVSLADLEPAAQEQVAAAGPGRADVVKVAHHGSRRQHEELYDLLGADLALITVGQDNTFGHPTDDVLQLLREDGTAVIRTDQHGTVVLPSADPAAARAVGPAR
ncbi:ComEC/Rec2 family competence protein [Brachybacterium alimentarium]|uniref:ComEC/Rec2 family competence protein n=1 Tax=Brachybacterium alimentarium TaxID=47845 RepID=UPI000DF3E795|nr:ComEC/Rec2 family competence protein [Brachybacterium alimentarium]RCS71859.1 ComEC/Rec2 family competence protein [Brachybacterium alimentarium]